MKKLLFLAILPVLSLCNFEAHAQNPTNSQKAQQLPPGHQFKSAFNGLPPQAKAKAEKWLNDLEIPAEDFEYLKVDSEGNIFYADTFNGATAEQSASSSSVPSIAEISSSEVFLLHSNPKASKVVYIDFDGHVLTGTAWNNAAGRSTLYAKPYDSNGNPSSFSSTEINEMAAIWHRIAEDYAPFDIDVTTEEPASFGPNVGRILITDRFDENNNPIYANASGGVAYVNVWGISSFEYYQPALVFYNHLGSTHSIAEASSHELGHNLSLSHDGTSSASYYTGHGSGEISWAPIMGAGYYRNVTQWSNGNYADANNNQQDIQEIANRLGFSADDHGNTTSSATGIVIESDGSVNATDPETDPFNSNTSNKGIIEKSSDVDMFYFDTSGGQVNLTVTPSWKAYDYESLRGSNLDVRLKLYNSSGSLINTYRLASETKANLSTTLNSGRYYLSIEGEGSSNYNDYGSQGYYYITGNIPSNANIDPIANFEYTVNDRTVTFTDTSTDDGVINSYSWNFGNGNTSTDQNPTYTYNTDGTFTVTLTVTDNNGGSDSISKQVVICLDSDGDGVCDSSDICPGGDDSVDSDGDGTPDFCDSCDDSVDSDSDGVSDCDDLEPNSPCPNNVDANGVSIDSDNDGVPNCNDICPGGDDTVDTDGDGTPDFCDTCDDTVDTDNDGVNDCNDQEPNSPCPNNVDNNGVSIDSDNDGVADCEDICPGGDDSIDSDGDGIPNFCDTCDDSIDTDGDGINDCDDQERNSPCPNNVDANGVSIDSDGDGVADCNDVCPGGDDSIDTDGDGTPDGCDTCDDTVDTDNDGVSDCDDQEPNSPCPNNVDANGISVDSDNDGVTNCNDVCPGGDDTIDSDGDGIPDFCDNCDDTVDTDNDGLNDCDDQEPNSPCPNNVDANGVSIDSDGDGVADCNDICPGGDDTVDTDGDGTPDFCDNCDDSIDTDGDGVADCIDQEVPSPCPGNVDANGISIDSDGDGVADCVDVCPNGDDTVDSDGDGTPDDCEVSECVAFTTNFDSNSLNHSGAGSSTTTLEMPANARNVSFIISDIDQQTGGKPDLRYIEQVSISYVDAAGDIVNYGVFSGTNSVQVDIQDSVQRVIVALTDGYDGDSVFSMSVNLSEVDFCIEDGACNDRDGDGVCDYEDNCPDVANPGQEDTDGDGVGDACDTADCVAGTTSFNQSTLTHTGGGSSSTSANLPPEAKDVSFSISGIDQVVSGKPTERYVEEVTITFDDGQGIAQTYGTFSGTNSVAVSIDGWVTSISVSLADGMGSTTSQMSVNLSTISFCTETGAATWDTGEPNLGEAFSPTISEGDVALNKAIKVYPNPVNKEINIALQGYDRMEGKVEIYNFSGQLLLNREINSKDTNRIDVANISDGLYLLIIKDSKGNNLETKRIAIKR